MASDATDNILVDNLIRQEAETLYKSMGMSLSAAINLFLTQSVIQGKLPLAEVIADPVYAEAVRRSISEPEKAFRSTMANDDFSTDELLALCDSQAILDSLVGIASSEPITLEQARNERLARQ